MSEIKKYSKNMRERYMHIYGMLLKSSVPLLIFLVFKNFCILKFI